MRRAPLTPWLLGAALAASAGVAQAQSLAEAVVQQLREQGYVEFAVTRTLLGRVRVVAQAADGEQREIVFNPATGEILRDYSEAANGSSAGPRILQPSNSASRPQAASSTSPPAGASPQPGGNGSSDPAGGPQPDEGDDGNRGHGNDEGGDNSGNPGRGTGTDGDPGRGNDGNPSRGGGNGNGKD